MFPKPTVSSPPFSAGPRVGGDTQEGPGTGDLDDAILRRMPTKIKLGYPSQAERVEILRVMPAALISGTPHAPPPNASPVPNTSWVAVPQLSDPKGDDRAMF